MQDMHILCHLQKNGMTAKQNNVQQEREYDPCVSSSKTKTNMKRMSHNLWVLLTKSNYLHHA
jgi:hypothetical protein